MTEKRFIAGDLWIQDKSSIGWVTYFLDEQNGVNDLCNLMNCLADENGQLKHRIKKLQNELNNYSEIFNELNSLIDDNEQLKKLLECSRKEANDYCEELMGKDEFIRLYKRQRDEVIEVNRLLKSENKLLKRDLEHCANQFKDDGKNVLLGLK